MTLPTLTTKIAQNGSLSVTSGSQRFDSNYDNSGTISVQTATLEITGNVFSSTSTAGTLAIGPSGHMQLDAGVDKNNIAFADGTGVLTIEALADFTAAVTITGLTPGDKILLGGLPAGFVENYNTSTGVLTLFSGPSVLGSLTFGGSSSPAASTVQDAVSAVAPCFAAGTRIATEHGDVAVEALRPGDAVVLADGGTLPAVWLGHRRVDCDRHLRPAEVWPVRIAAGAFGTGMPTCELLLSPDHAVLIDDVLIPVRYLVNGATVTQQPVESVTYWHVELARHAVILAAGLPCESYLDTGNRGAFANGGTYAQLHPDIARMARHAPGEASPLSKNSDCRAIPRCSTQSWTAGIHLVAVSTT